MPWRRKWQPSPVLLPGKSIDRGVWRAAVHGVAKEWMEPGLAGEQQPPRPFCDPSPT